MLIKSKKSRFSPKYKICAQSINCVWLNKNSRMHKFYYVRGKFLKPKGKKKKFLLSQNLKWTIIRNRRLSLSFKAKSHSFKRKNSFIRSYYFFLQQKQQLKKFYGKLQEKKLLLLFTKNNNSKLSNNKKQKFISLLEGRVDVVLLRAKLVPTIFFSHQFINHKGVLVNEKLITTPNYSIKFGDIVSLDVKFWNLFYKILYKKVITRVFNTFFLTYVKGRKSFLKFIVVLNYATIFKNFNIKVSGNNVFKFKNLNLIYAVIDLLDKFISIFFKYLKIFSNEIEISYLLNISLYLQNIICQVWYNCIFNLYLRNKRLKLKKDADVRFYRGFFLNLQRKFVQKIYTCFYNLIFFYKFFKQYSLLKSTKNLIEDTNLSINKSKINVESWSKNIKLKILYSQIFWSKYLKKMIFVRNKIYPLYLKIKTDPEEDKIVNNETFMVKYMAYFGLNFRLFTDKQLRKSLAVTFKEKRRKRKFFLRRLRKKNKRKLSKILALRKKSFVCWRFQSHWFTPKYLEVDYLTLRVGFILNAEENEVFFPFNFSFGNLISLLKSRSY